MMSVRFYPFLLLLSGVPGACTAGRVPHEPAPQRFGSAGSGAARRALEGALRRLTSPRVVSVGVEDTLLRLDLARGRPRYVFYRNVGRLLLFSPGGVLRLDIRSIENKLLLSLHPLDLEDARIIVDSITYLKRTGSAPSREELKS